MTQLPFIDLTAANGLMYILAFLFLAFRLRRLNIGMAILLLFSISNIISIFYYATDGVASKYNHVTLFPYIYLFTMIMLCIYPLIMFDHRKISIIVAPGSMRLIKMLSVFVIVVTIEPFVENVLLIAKVDSNSYQQLGELYLRKFEGENVYIHSEIGRRLNYISVLFSTAMAVFLFYYMSRPRRNVWLITGSAMVVVNTILTYFNSSNRAGVLSYFLFTFSCYLLFKSTISIKIVKRVEKIGVIFLLLIVSLTAVITLARFSYSDSSISLFSWVALYGGEGPLKFNNDLWWITHHTNGDDMFAFLKNMIGLDTFTDVLARDQYYSSKNGIQIENFYTVIGDMYYDLGDVGTPFFCLLISIVLRYLTRMTKKRVFFLDTIFGIAIFAHIFFMGFAAYIHRAYSAQFALLFPLGIIAVLYTNRKFNTRRLSEIEHFPPHELEKLHSKTLIGNS